MAVYPRRPRVTRSVTSPLQFIRPHGNSAASWATRGSLVLKRDILERPVWVAGVPGRLSDIWKTRLVGAEARLCRLHTHGMDLALAARPVVSAKGAQLSEGRQPCLRPARSYPRGSAGPAFRAQGREVGATPEMSVAPEDQVSPVRRA